MFPGKIAAARIPTVEAGLPSLNRVMAAAEITTPPRIAAFLTTLCFESRFEYNIHQIGSSAMYAGRGFIQLTGSGNYEAAGKYLDIELLAYPDLACSLEWSAEIARWYWTVARHCNSYADALAMGKVNAAIGYPLSGPGSDGLTNDERRCAAFAKALEYLTGTAPVGVTCNR